MSRNTGTLSYLVCGISRRVRALRDSVSGQLGPLLRPVIFRMVHRVDLGGGLNKYPGWVSLDLATGIDLVRDRLDFIPDESLTHAMSHHFFEHICFVDAVTVVSRIRTKLKPGARIRIAVPDKFDRDNARSLMEHGHVFAWSHESARSLADAARMEINLIHYYDEEANFHDGKDGVRVWEVDTERQELITDCGRFQIIHGIGRVNTFGGIATPEHSLLFDLIKPTAVYQAAPVHSVSRHPSSA